MKRDLLWAIWQMVVYGFLATLMIAAPATGWADQSDERLEEFFDRLSTTATLWWLELSRSPLGGFGPTADGTT